MEFIGTKTKKLPTIEPNYDLLFEPHSHQKQINMENSMFVQWR